MRDARFTEFFGDDYYDFRLPYGLLLELQEKTEVGPLALLRRLESGDWKIQDVAETIRLGLIGGGKVPAEAFKLVKRYVHERPPMENVVLAKGILLIALVGAPEEDKKASTNNQEEGDGKLKSKDAYGFGAVVGFTPQEMNDMSLHQMNSVFDGYTNHHQASNGVMTEKVKDELFDMVQEEQARMDGLA